MTAIRSGTNRHRQIVRPQVRNDKRQQQQNYVFTVHVKNLETSGRRQFATQFGEIDPKSPVCPIEPAQKKSRFRQTVQMLGTLRNRRASSRILADLIGHKSFSERREKAPESDGRISPDELEA
jgi:hypothetical protein